MLRNLILMCVLVFASAQGFAESAREVEANRMVIANDIAANYLFSSYKAKHAEGCKQPENSKMFMCSQNIDNHAGIIKNYLTYKILTVYKEDTLKFAKCISESAIATSLPVHCKDYIEQVGEWLPTIPEIIISQNKLTDALSQANNAKTAK